MTRSPYYRKLRNPHTCYIKWWCKWWGYLSPVITTEGQSCVHIMGLTDFHVLSLTPVLRQFGFLQDMPDLTAPDLHHIFWLGELLVALWKLGLEGLPLRLSHCLVMTILRPLVLWPGFLSSKMTKDHWKPMTELLSKIYLIYIYLANLASFFLC